MKTAIVYFLSARVALSAATAAHQEPPDTDPFAWIDCEEFVDHLGSLTTAAKLKHPRSHQGYSPTVCSKVFSEFKKYPKLVDGVINLGSFYEERAHALDEVRKASLVPDKAGELRRAALRKLQQASEPVIPACPPVGSMLSPRLPCINQEFAGPVVVGGTEEFIFEDFDPAYGSGGFYESVTNGLTNGNAPTTVTDGFQDVVGIGLDEIWDGAPSNRTNAGPVGSLLITLTALQNAATILSYGCDAIPDDALFNIIPNPFKIVCHVALAVLQDVELAADSLYAAADFQDGLVDAAEIEAAYEHTTNLLHKQCAIFDQVVCRAPEDLGSPSVGRGCDGVDSNCDGEIDECDEDLVPPQINVKYSLESCSKGRYFPDLVEATNCVMETVDVYDDCHPATYTISEEAGSRTCETRLLLDATDDVCGTGATQQQVPVMIDSTPPTVSCTLDGSENAVVTLPNDNSTGNPRVIRPVEFRYTEADDCDDELDVKVDIFSNELDAFGPLRQDFALFSPRGDLFLQNLACTNGQQCIQDPSASGSRIYTAVVTAVDSAGNEGVGECTYTVVRSNGSPPDVSASTQRFLLTSFVSSDVLKELLRKLKP